MKTLAYKHLATSTSVETKAADYVKSIKQSIKVKLLQPLKQRIADLKFKVKELEEMSLEHDANKGLIALSKDDCEKRFLEIIELNAQIKLLELEYKNKKNTYKHYFQSNEVSK